MKVFEDVISPAYQERINNIMHDVSFKWGLLDDVTYGTDDALRSKFPHVKGTPGFAHLFYDKASGIQSEHLDFILPLLLSFTGTNNFDLIRIKGGLLLPTSTGHNMPHVDFDEPGLTTALYYVNDSDGNTVFFDDTYNMVEEIKPQRGKVVIFDGLTYHASTCPTLATNRITLNFNYALRS
tara:strand:+ start:3123 stop:3665 length:543 start_codon:yes stop_codon:yes gene_type:complete